MLEVRSRQPTAGSQLVPQLQAKSLPQEQAVEETVKKDVSAESLDLFPDAPPAGDEVGAEAELTGRVDQIRYSAEGFTVGRLRLEDGRRVDFAGKLHVRANDRVILYGTWEEHPKYGKQLRVHRFRLDEELTRGGLAAFLAVNPAVRGIGPGKARVLADRFGETPDEFEHHLRNSQLEMARAAQVGVDVIENLAEVWLKDRESNAVKAWLAGLGLTMRQIDSVYGKYKESAGSVLRANPYLLARDVRGFGFKRADEVAQSMGTAPDAEERIEAALEHAAREVHDDGHTWVDYGECVARAAKLTGMALSERGGRTLDRLVLEGKLTGTWLSAEVYAISTPKMLRRERELGLVVPLLGRAPNPHLAKLLELGPVGAHGREGELTPGQRKAVATALGRALSVITGGAGTGKSFTMARIATRYLDAGMSVAMAAPTGKAARRMSELLQDNRVQAVTIHRLLGYDGENFGRHRRRDPESPQAGQASPAGRLDENERETVEFDENGKLQVDCLLIDESSMLDVRLTWELLQVVDGARTAVVLFGDPNQLPSVGAGNVLRDVIQRQLAPVAVLDQVMRQAGVLRENSARVLAGQVVKTSKGREETDAPWPWVVVKRASEAAVAAKVGALFARVLKEKRGVDPWRDVQLLVPKKVGSAGAESLNVGLQRLAQKVLRGFDVPALEEGRPPKIYPGDRVIQVRNNYELGVMNGTVGWAVGVEENERGKSVLVCEMDGEELEYSAGDARDLRLAYAITVHKAQGSEFPVAVVVMHRGCGWMLNRSLLYTAVTRARRMVVLVGDEVGLEAAAARVSTERRRTMLGLLPS